MKRKNNSKLNEAVQIPYRLQDFKAGDRVHIIGNFDGEEFDDLGTIVTTSNEIDNPWSHDASFLVKFDEPQQEEHDLHDSETRFDWVRNRCQGNCWWIWMGSFISDYGLGQEFEFYNKRNRVIKIGEALPDAYDVISSLYESTDLIKENLIYPGIKVGDEVIITIGDEGLTYGPIINNFATVVDVTEGGTLLVKLKNFNKGHDGNNNIHCGERDCLFINGSWYEKLSVRPVDLGIPDAYDVISSLYESEDLDWASDMVNDIGKSIITPGQYYRINGKLSHHPFDDTIDLYIKEVFPEHNYVIFDIISSDPKNNERISLQTVITLIDTKCWYPISKEEGLFDKKILTHDIILDESEDFDWAMDMVNNINFGMASIPTEDDRKYYVILFDEPGIKYETFEAIENHIQQKTVWSFTADPDKSASTIYEYYKRGWSPYIRLFPGPELGYGDSEDTFKSSTGLYLNNPLVNIIRPY